MRKEIALHLVNRSPQPNHAGHRFRARRVCRAFFLDHTPQANKPTPATMYRKVMATGSPSKTSAAAELAQKLHEALLRERIVPRFVDSYVVENSREALQVHAVMYRDLLTLLQREALLALSARALEIVYNEPRAQGRSKPRPMRRREAALFRKKFLTALVRQLGWTAGDALDFQRDLQCDSSFLEKARLAASKALTSLEELATQIVHPASKDPHDIKMRPTKN
ncbi:MAG: hypothetical protein DMG40_25160 [Acidobacteria bacterium]|nr:MAG: hypothetical protein DMG40_25160 [Acidobacteriota bacterium]